MPSATALSFVGVAKEPVRGSGVVPSNFVAVKTITPEDVVKYLAVETLQGSMAKTYGLVQGYKNTTFEVQGPVFPDTFGWSLMGVLGDVVTTASRTVADGVTNSTTLVTSATAAWTVADVGKSISGTGIPSGTFIFARISGTNITLSQAATATGSGITLTIGAPQTHVGSLLNSGTGQPTSQTLTDFYGLTTGSPARQYAGIQWHEVMVKATAEGLLEHTSKATGLVSSLSVAKPVQSFTGVAASPSWAGYLTIGGVQVSKAFDAEVTINRVIELIPGMNGTQQYAQVWIGEATAKGKANFFIDDDTELTRMLSNTQPSLDLNWTSGTGAAAVQVRLHMTNAAYIKAKPNRGKQYVAYDIEFEAVANTTDVGASGGYSPILAVVGNNIASGTYQ